MLKRRKGGVAGVHVAHHAQVVDKGGVTRAGLVVAEELRPAAAGWKRVELGKCGVLHSCAGHGKHAHIYRPRG